VPTRSANKLPQLGPASVVSLWSYDSGPQSYQRLVIPKQLITSLAAAAR
jgi:hypothetical protein